MCESLCLHRGGNSAGAEFEQQKEKENASFSSLGLWLKLITSLSCWSLKVSLTLTVDHRHQACFWISYISACRSGFVFSTCFICCSCPRVCASTIYTFSCILSFITWKCWHPVMLMIAKGDIVVREHYHSFCLVSPNSVLSLRFHPVFCSKASHLLSLFLQLLSSSCSPH